MSRIALLSLGWLVLAAAVICGEEPSPGALLRRISAIRIEVASGKIACPTLARASNRTFSDEHGGSKESLSINAGSEEPSLSYRYAGPGREWILDLHGNSLRLSDKSATETLVYEQHAEVPLKLTLQTGASSARQITARSLWHWLVFSPEIRGVLLPRLESLRSDWELGQQADQIRQELIKADQRPWTSHRGKWEKAVSQLRDADYQIRQSADRMLRSGGSPAAAFLEAIDEEKLDQEQRRRVARIVAAAAHDIDEPTAIAAAWCFDGEVWCHLLQDAEPAVRALAADHLSQLLGRPLVFDPSAQAPIRSAQLRVIEETLLRR